MALHAFEIEQTRFRQAHIFIPDMMKGGGFEWLVCVLCKPRPCGQLVFWSLANMYEYFRMKTYRNCSSVWVSRQKSTWAVQWTKAFGSSQLIEGTTISGRSQAKSNKPFTARCLPEPCVSTLGMLAFLGRWQVEDSKQATAVPGLETNAHEFLSHLILSCSQCRSGETSWSFNLVFDPAWKPRWPRAEPSPDGVHVIQLVVDVLGLVSLVPWKKAMDNHVKIALQWWELIRLNSVGGCGDAIDFTSFASFAVKPSASDSIANQMLYVLSLRLDRVFAYRAKHAAELCFEAVDITMEFVDDSESTASHHQPYICASYAFYAKQRLQRPVDLGIATDKGWAHGLPLQATFMTVPTNFAAVAPPVVCDGSLLSLFQISFQNAFLGNSPCRLFSAETGWCNNLLSLGGENNYTVLVLL
jgi:hypothetical protein